MRWKGDPTFGLTNTPEPIVAAGKTLDEVRQAIDDLLIAGYPASELRIHAGKLREPFEIVSEPRQCIRALKPGNTLFGVVVV
jgi:hypothetical protein